MNEAKQIPQPDALDVRQIARAIRFALVAIVLGLSYLIFRDMLGGKPLPRLTQFVLSARPLFVAVSILVPLVAVATLFLRGVTASFYIIGMLVCVTVVQCITIYHGLLAPLTQIISAMSSSL